MKRGIFHKRSIDVCVGEMVFATPMRPTTLVFEPGEEIVVAVPKSNAGGGGEYQFLFTVEAYEGDDPTRAEKLFGRSAWRHLYRLGSATTIDPFSLDDLVAIAGSRGDQVRERYRGQTQHHRIVRDVYPEDEPLFRALLVPGTEPVWVASVPADDNELEPVRAKARARTREDLIRRLRTMSQQSTKTPHGKQYRPGKTQKRNTEFTELVRTLYNDTCQVCGLQLCRPNGAAGGSHVHHFEAWNGDSSDRLANVICVCPNDHTRFGLGSLRWSPPVLERFVDGKWSSLELVVDHHLTVPLRVSSKAVA